MAVTAESAQLAKTGTGVVGTALTTAGSFVLTIPVVGWIVGGIMVAVGGALSFASSRYNVERAAARGQMLQRGTSPEFANAFARAQSWPDSKLQQELDQAVKAAGRNLTRSKLETVAGFRHALYMRSIGATVDTAIATQDAQLAAEVERAGTVRRFVIGGSVLLSIAMVAIVYGRRR